MYVASALLYCMDSVPAFRVKLGANNLNCVDVPLNPTHSLSDLGMHIKCETAKCKIDNV